MVTVIAVPWSGKVVESAGATELTGAPTAAATGTAKPFTAPAHSLSLLAIGLEVGGV